MDFERVKHDLEVARDIQRGLLPKNESRYPNYDIVGFYEAAEKVGGDYYDIVDLDDGRIAVLQGDVAGHGIPAAIFMARISSATLYAIQNESTLSAAFARLNKQAGEMSDFDRFITMCAAILDPVSHTVTLVNAGHNIPLLYSASNGKLEEAMHVDQIGLPLGVVEDTDYSEWNFELSPGSSLLIFTDGLTEGRNTEGDFFGD